MDRRIKIFDVPINDLSYADLELAITKSFLEKRQLIIGYCTANKLNLAYSNTSLSMYLSRFDLIHADGVGVLLASKILYGSSGLKHRITGSDFYPLLANEGIKKGWKFFFFGDTEETLRKISSKNPLMKIAGALNGYNFETDLVNKKINESAADILIVGLGSPLQEKWIIDNKEKLNAKIILAIGNGIKIFAGSRIRGPRFLQKLGFEWLVRLITNPTKMWRRYLIGIPQFIFRVIFQKIHSFTKK